MSNKEERLARVYTYIKERIETMQGAPTQREIAQACELAYGSVNDYLSLLEGQGKITREPYKSRSIRLVRSDKAENTDHPENEVADAVYAYLVNELEAGKVPTQKEIAEGCFLSRSAVRQALLWLVAQKRIELVEGQRNIRLL